MIDEKGSWLGQAGIMAWLLETHAVDEGNRVISIYPCRKRYTDLDSDHCDQIDWIIKLHYSFLHMFWWCHTCRNFIMNNFINCPHLFHLFETVCHHWGFSFSQWSVSYPHSFLQKKQHTEGKYNTKSALVWATDPQFPTRLANYLN